LLLRRIRVRLFRFGIVGFFLFHSFPLLCFHRRNWLTNA
jgi:hypothetical protein